MPFDTITTVDRFRGCLLGLACGDAVGTTVEFQPRGSFAPVNEMVGGGPFGLLPGEWTDDTSMALCLATSLVKRKRFDPDDQMRLYTRWMNDGYLSSNGRCFDIGLTIGEALAEYARTGEPNSGSTNPHSAGNGCIMRLAPVPMFYYPNIVSAINYSAKSLRTTHGARECVDACRLFGAIICQALRGDTKEQMLFGQHFPESVDHQLTDRIQWIADGNYRDKQEDTVSGNGYVVNCLDAALWCFLVTDNYRDAVLRATNLGDDADTTAAVCGQLAGAYYGMLGIPDSWREQVALHDQIINLADQLRQIDPQD